MTTIENQVIEPWRTHNHITISVIENIPDEALKATLSTRGGRDIGRQFAHMNAVRVWQLEAFAKKQSLPLTSFPKDETPAKNLLLEAFEQTSLAMEKYLEHSMVNKESKATNFKGGVVAMLCYFISHEAHHRGNIFLTLKQCGYKISDEMKWGIWNEMRK
jgi:uncharacterized damage-inducible protein DinB